MLPGVGGPPVDADRADEDCPLGCPGHERCNFW